MRGYRERKFGNGDFMDKTMIIIAVVIISIIVCIYIWYYNRKNPVTTSSSDGIGHDETGNTLSLNDMTSNWQSSIHKDTTSSNFNDISKTFRSIRTP